MKLNLDCIRDILLIIEDEQTMRKIDQSNIGESGILETGMVQPIYDGGLLSHNKLKTYSSDDIFYSIKQLGENGLLDVNTDILSGGRQYYEILDITPEGHEFISNIRNLNIWNKVKSLLKGVSGASLPIVGKVATETLLKHLLTS